ncbi:MAG: SDR family oxidoreductase [Verrucomicrobia bacterium]|nr:SDR family oxidoreductase [Verrucomicrobiota bacterium]MDA1086113.1 SDR family oxidoreductase [Verrucomicrobiota bacterium]
MSILGCGWYGLALGAALVECGYHVRGSTRTAERLGVLREHDIEPFPLDLNPGLQDGQAADFFESDALVLNIPPGRDETMAQRYAAQIKAVATAVAGSRCRFVIFVSSTSVYPELRRIVTETDGNDPEKRSGRVLRQAECELLGHSDFACTVLRMAGLIGPGRLPGNFLQGKSDVPRGDAPVNLVHRDDAVGATCQVLEQSIRNQVFNVVAEKHPRRRDYYQRAAAAIGVPPPTFVDEPECAWKIVSGEKLKRELNYTYRYPDPESCI